MTQGFVSWLRGLAGGERAALWAITILVIAVLILTPRDAVTLITTLGVTVALAALVWQIRAARQDRAFSVLQRLLDTYENIRQKRQEKWVKIKSAIKANPNLQYEIDDTTGTIDYLLLRVRQDEERADWLRAIEHGLLEDEIQGMNVLNEVCRLSARDKRLQDLSKALFASEIAFYQARYEDLEHISRTQRSTRRFSVPRNEALRQFRVDDFFDGPQR